MTFSRLYPLIDASVLAARGVSVGEFAKSLRMAGVSLVQWRDKVGSPQEVLTGGSVLREVFAGTECRLVMNDRADLAVLAGFGGVHVGQGDLSPEDAKAVLLQTRRIHALKPHEWGTRHVGERAGIVGVSTHTDEQVTLAEASCADYVAVGPVFATGTKLDAETVIGLEGVRRARALTGKPLVAIGGITRENARSVIEAGADSVAVISGLLVKGERVEDVARDFLQILG